MWTGGPVPAYDIRWRSLSAIPTQTLRLHLCRELVARVAEQVADTDLASLHLVPHVGFQDPLLTQIALALWRELKEPPPPGDLYAYTPAPLLPGPPGWPYTARSPPARAAYPAASGLTGPQSKHVLKIIRPHL